MSEFSHLVSALPQVWGETLAQADMKTQPSDFRVQERLGYELDGKGEHLYLYIRKQGLNTNDVVEQLQRLFACHSADMGVSGLKDKFAVTEQWISVRSAKEASELGLSATLNPEQGVGIELDVSLVDTVPEADVDVPFGEFRVLLAKRHGKKLRRGAHSNNVFTLLLRRVKPHTTQAVNESDEPDEATGAFQQRMDARLACIAGNGFVNYFGPQRFGIEQQNIVKALRYFSAPRRKISRTQRGMLISAARSALFNAICRARVEAGTWNQPLVGEPLVLNNSRSFFIHDGSDDGVAERCAQFDVHPSAALWGRGSSLALADSDCARLEQAVIEPYEALRLGLENAGLQQERRALRAMAEALEWQWLDSAQLRLHFSLQKGVYATSLLAELADYTVAQHQQHRSDAPLSN